MKRAFDSGWVRTHNKIKRTNDLICEEKMYIKVPCLKILATKEYINSRRGRIMDLTFEDSCKFLIERMPNIDEYCFECTYDTSLYCPYKMFYCFNTLKQILEYERMENYYRKVDAISKCKKPFRIFVINIDLYFVFRFSILYICKYFLPFLSL